MTIPWWFSTETEQYTQFLHACIFKHPDMLEFDSENWEPICVNELDMKREYNWRIEQPGAPLEIAIYLFSQTPNEAFESMLTTPVIGNYPQGFNPDNLAILVSELKNKSQRAA